jgi:hypothetical protein
MKTLLEYVFEDEILSQNEEFVNDFINELDSTEIYTIDSNIINKYLNIKTKKVSIEDLIKTLNYKENVDYIYKDFVVYMSITSFKLGLVTVKSKQLKLFLLLDDTINMYKKRLYNEQLLEIKKLQSNSTSFNILIEYENKILEQESQTIKQEEIIMNLESKIKLLEELNSSNKIIEHNKNNNSDQTNGNIQSIKTVFDDTVEKIDDIYELISEMNDKIDNIIKLEENKQHCIKSDIKKIKSTVII